MKKKFDRILSAVLIPIMLFTGCESSESNSDKAENHDAYISMSSVIDNNYIFSKDNETAEYLDFTTMSRKPFCSKANCTHNDGSCMSRAFLGTKYGPIPCNGSIYFFGIPSSTWTDEDDDGREETEEVEDSLVRYDIKSDSTQIVAKIKGAEGCCYNGACVIDGIIYFVANRAFTEFAELPGLKTPENIPMESYLYSFDTKTEKLKNYGSIYKDDLTYSGAERTRNFIIKGYSDGKLYLYYSYLDDISKEDTIPNETHLCFTFDIESGSVERSDEAPPELIREGYRCHTENGNAVVYKGNDTWTFSAPDGGFYLNELSLVDDKIWCLSEGWYYDLKKSDKLSCKTVSGGQAQVIGKTNECYIYRINQNDDVSFEQFSIGDSK